jgi:GH15 family glucan-1,4-alpha-glucosidase
VEEELNPDNRIQDYGAIGDCRSAALVSRRGSIDWLCWPRFDSPSIFAAILDQQHGGFWSIAPTGSFKAKQQYVEDTNVLETHFRSHDGYLLLKDLMPVASERFKRSVLLPDHELARELRCIEGESEIEVNFCPRAGYGRDAVLIRESGALGLRVEVGRGAYWLRSSVPLTIRNNGGHAVIKMKRGDLAQFVLTYTERAPSVLPALGDPLSARIDCSVRWWQQWARLCSYDGPYRESVIRSALVLKLLSYAPSGAIIAAATTSLPERIGGSLNWDYRYCWLRDASLTIRAMLGLSYTAEAADFLTWLLHATALTQPKLRVLCSLYGEMAPHEREIPFLCGYRDSRPVRIGNSARSQLQLDVYGEVIDAAAQYARSGASFDKTTQDVLVGFGKYVARNWDRPDEGIWEPRSGRKNHTNSRLMCWTALDRLLEMHTKGRISSMPKDLFEKERQSIREQIEQRAWNSKIQSYTKTLDGTEVDASLLRIPWYGFEKANSDRMRSTYSRVCEDLGAGDGLLYRYKRNPPEGAFGICGFWGAEYLAIGGASLQQAHALFGELLGYQNELGLFAEEIDPPTGDALGNFPQAFTHVGLISAALSIKERERGEAHPAEKRHQAATPVAREVAEKKHA